MKETRPKDLDKIVPIEGDMELGRLGLKSDDQKTILENVSSFLDNLCLTRELYYLGGIHGAEKHSLFTYQNQ